MKKLLHERLREYSEDRYVYSCNTKDIASVIGVDTDCRDLCSECCDRIYGILADEIERYYIPRESCSNCALPDKELSDQEYGEAYDKGYEAAAKDPKAWYVEDKHGEPMRLGDEFRYSESGQIYECRGFEFGDDAVFILDEGFYFADDCEKVILETREKVKEDIAYSLIGISESDIPMVMESALAVAEKFISHVEALERD